MTRIPLTQGQFAEIDDADAAAVCEHSWHAVRIGNHWYAATNVNGIRVYLHRFLLGPAPIRIDHRNLNGLNNRRSNLRSCTQQQNLANRPKSKNNKSGYKGVCWDKSRGRWKATIGIAGRLINIGRYDDIIVAAQAYDSAAKEHHGDFAHLNFKES